MVYTDEQSKIIGIFGAIGYDDFGDDALLMANLKMLYNSKDIYIIFSSNIAKTTSLLISNGYIPSNALTSNIVIVSSFENHSSINIIKYFDYVLDTLLRSKWNLFQTIQVYNRIKSISNDKNNIYFQNVSKCSLVYFIGGGYMNYNWGINIYQFISALLIAKNFNIPCVASGQTFGPLSTIQKRILRKHINKLDLILVRDINRSKRRLLEIGYDENKIKEGPDDAIFFDHDVDFSIEKKSSFTVTVNFGLYLKYSRYSISHIYDLFAKYFDYLVEEKDASILNISMVSRTADIDQGLVIQSKMKHKDRFYTIPLCTDLKKIKKIIADSDLIFSSRLHPIVFSISEKIPFVGIASGGEYYNSKLMGISEIYGLSPENHIIEVDNISLNELKTVTEKALNANFNTKYYDLNKKRREDFLDVVFKNYLYNK